MFSRLQIPKVRYLLKQNTTVGIYGALMPQHLVIPSLLASQSGLVRLPLCSSQE